MTGGHLPCLDMPLSFQGMMAIILAGCKGALWFLYDIVVVSARKKQLLHGLNQVFVQVSDDGLQ